jgi:hypothetical protein
MVYIWSTEETYYKILYMYMEVYIVQLQIGE